MNPAALIFLGNSKAQRLAVAWEACKGDRRLWLQAAGLGSCDSDGDRPGLLRRDRAAVAVLHGAESGRRGVGLEAQEQHCEIAARRLEVLRADPLIRIDATM